MTWSLNWPLPVRSFCLRRGEVWEATLSPRSGSEQQGKRPVILLMRENFLRAENWRSILVVPLTTSASQGQRGPTVVPLPAGTAGLPLDSFALGHQFTTLDRSKITHRLGEVSPSELLAVEKAVIVAAGITWVTLPHS